MDPHSSFLWRFNSLRAVRRAWIPKGPLLELIFAWLREGSTFGAHFLTRGFFWSHFGFMFASFFGYFGSFFVLGRTLGALGAHFFITKTVWTTKGAPIGISPKMASFFGAILESFFVIFWICWALFFSFVFCCVPEPIFHGCWLHFDTIFWYLFVLVRTSGFSDFWQPFHSKTRFLQVQGYQV